MPSLVECMLSLSFLLVAFFFCDRSNYAIWSSNVALKKEPMPNSMVTSEKDFANYVECGLVVLKNVSGTTTTLSIVMKPTD